jgi:hypothetical protein
MADPAVLGLIGTISGTAIGFAGGLITQLLLEHRKQAGERRKKKAEKLEELTCELHTYENWVAMLPIIVKPGEDALLAFAKSPPTSFVKLRSISNVYFPEFGDLIRALGMAVAEYLNWLSKDRNRSQIDNAKAIQKPLTLVGSLENRIMDYAKCEFQ